MDSLKWTTRNGREVVISLEEGNDFKVKVGPNSCVCDFTDIEEVSDIPGLAALIPLNWGEQLGLTQERYKALLAMINTDVEDPFENLVYLDVCPACGETSCSGYDCGPKGGRR